MLIGPSMSFNRMLAIRFCELRGLAYEFVSLSKDVTAADLRERRSIRNGALVFDMGPVLRAAVEGKVLILEGISKVESNLLPMINELLENRQMELEGANCALFVRTCVQKRCCVPIKKMDFCCRLSTTNDLINLDAATT